MNKLKKIKLSLSGGKQLHRYFKFLQQIELVKKGIHQFTKKVEDDRQIDQYIDQFAFSKREIINNLSKFCENSEYFNEINDKMTDSSESEGGVVKQIITYLRRWLIEKDIYGIYDRNNYQKHPICRTTRIFQFQSKLVCFGQFFYSAINFEKDITCFPLYTQNKYSHVYKNIVLNNHGNEQKLSKDYNRMKRLMVITNSAVFTQSNSQYSLVKKIVFGLSFPRFFINFNQGELRCFAFFRKPTAQMLKNIWNLPEKGAISRLKYVQYQSISTNEELYVPRNFVSTSQNLFEIHEKRQNSICVRILHFQDLDFKQRPKKCRSCCYGQSQDLEIDTVILHAHGGGFIALSSQTMQNYTRRWANNLKVPVLSVDYGKPPQHIFPQPVYDMLRIYEFIFNQLHLYTNIKVKKIVLAGDSAGGNLICSLVGLILKHKLPKPHGVFLAYPACDTRLRYSPSRLLSFDDAILYPTLLLLCLNEYLGYKTENQYDPLASPLLLSEEYVSGVKGDKRFPLSWPQTIIMIGKKDPLFDDSIRLCQRLTNSNIKYRCEVYKNFSHGFLSIQKMVDAADQTIQDSINFLSELLK